MAQRDQGPRGQSGRARFESSSGQDSGEYGAGAYGGEAPDSGGARSWPDSGVDAPSFLGRGPRGYQRSDGLVRDDICERLAYDPDLDATDITVTVSDGEVQLSGEVEDPIDKRHAEAVAEDVRGVREVHNQLRARRGLIAGLVNRMTGESEADKTGKGPSTRSPDVSRQ